MAQLNLAEVTSDDLLNIPSKDLIAFQVVLNNAIEQRKEQDKIQLHNEMLAMASERGFSLDEFLGASAKKIKIVKYKNPANPKQIWAGRGRKPNWLLDLLNSGRRLEEFRI